MPTRPLTQKDKPKDNKQILLDLIAKQYGSNNAIVMEKALKTQDKQIEEAMTQGGMTADDIGKSIGIDLSSLGMTKPIKYTQKPASSPLGFGGVTMENGQITEQQPGLLAGLLSTLVTGNPKTSASMDLSKLLKTSQIQRQQQMSQDKGFYQFNPTTGELEQIAVLPKGAEVRNRQVSPKERAEAFGEVSKDVAKFKEEIKRESPERVQMASNLDQMDILLTDMENYLVKDPDVFIKGLNPLGEREFKAILQNFDKTAAIAAGGKQLTKTELDLIRHTRPTILDTKNQKAISYKFNILRNTIALAKERLNKGTKFEKPQEQSQQFTIGGKTYNIPADKVEAFKKAKGIK